MRLKPHFLSQVVRVMGFVKAGWVGQLSSDLAEFIMPGDGSPQAYGQKKNPKV